MIFCLMLSRSGYAAEKLKHINAEGVIAWGRGGGTDLLARTLISYINAKYKDLNIVPVNRTGFAGAAALQYAYNQKPDGTTILFSAENPTLFSMLGYGDKNYKDFDCILLAGKETVGLIVPTNSGWRTVHDIVDTVKSDVEVVEASTNIGGMIWNITGMLNHLTGVNFVQEWYTDDKSAMEAVFTGQADFTFAKIQLAREAIRNGRVRYIAMISDEEIEGFEDVPSITKEYPEFKNYLPWGSFYGVFVKKGTPPEIIQRWQEAFIDAYNSDAFQRYLRINQMDALGLQGDEANKYIDAWGNKTLTALSKGELNMNYRFSSLED